MWKVFGKMSKYYENVTEYVIGNTKLHTQTRTDKESGQLHSRAERY